MDDKLHQLIESEYAETHAASRKLFGEAYLESTKAFRSLRSDVPGTKLPLEHLEITGDTAGDNNKAPTPVESLSTVPEAKSRASTVMDLFKSLDKNHDGMLDKAEIAEGLDNVKDHPKEEQALLFLQRHYDLIHRLKCGQALPNLKPGISQGNLEELDYLENGRDTLLKAVTDADLGAGVLGGMVLGGVAGGVACALAFPAAGVYAPLAGAFVAPFTGILGAHVGATASIFDFYGVNKTEMQAFLKDVPSARSKEDSTTLPDALTDWVRPHSPETGY